MYLSQTTETYGNQDHSWLGSAEGTQSQRSATLAIAAFTEETHYASGYLPDGLALAKATSGTYSGKWVPLAARPNEVQTVSITGTPTGGTFTLTFDGETTAGIAYNANAATVQAALEALSNVGPNAVTVTGGPGPGTAWVVTFSGTEYQGSNVPAMTTSGASLTGGTSPASAVAQTTGGGSGVTDASDLLTGFLYMPVAVPEGATEVIGSVLVRGIIRTAELPISLTAQQKATSNHFIWI
jgi:hypothetical protein